MLNHGSGIFLVLPLPASVMAETGKNSTTIKMIPKPDKVSTLFKPSQERDSLSFPGKSEHVLRNCRASAQISNIS